MLNHPYLFTDTMGDEISSPLSDPALASSFRGEMALDANETKKSTPDCNLTWQYQQ